MATIKRLPTRLIFPPISPLRHFTTTTINPARKQIVLEKPTKFNPPSHGSRLPRRGAPRGAALPTYGRSEEEKAKDSKRRYPHMMPPEGTVLHWFLTNRSIHVWITMSILTSLAFFTFLTNFLSTTPFTDQLPPNNFFFSHPLAFLSQYFSVYRLHSEHVSQMTAEHRRQKVEDVRKRSEYRKAHGLEDGSGGTFGGWTVRRDEEVLGSGMKEGGEGVGGVVGGVGGGAGETEAAMAREGGGERVKRPVRKWLGIW